MQTKGQLVKNLNTAFSFAPPSILSLTICLVRNLNGILNNDYETQEFLNNIILIGSDGGDMAYGIDISGKYVEVPLTVQRKLKGEQIC